MDTHTAQALHARNRTIIDAVLARAARLCPDALDLIAITGSFASGDFHRRSDLDLLIVINDPAGQQLARCFAMGDVAHDIYCQSRERLEHTATYPHPHVTGLLDAEVVYCRDEQVAQWYAALGETLRRRMASAPDADTLSAVRGHLDGAWQDYGRLCVQDDFGRCAYYAAGVLYRIEYAVYMCNGAYIRHGIRGIPREICALPRLPDDFSAHYHALIDAQTVEDIRRTAGALLYATDRMVGALQEACCPRKPLSAEALRGTHEEICSNWRGKMYRAAEEDDRYLSWMSEASAQAFYDDMAATYDMPPVTLLAGAYEPDLSARAHRFDDALRRYGEHYVRAGAAFCRYDTVEQFVADYLK